MIFNFEEQFSDSVFVEAIYHTRSVGGGSFAPIAAAQRTDRNVTLCLAVSSFLVQNSEKVAK